jgi:hypothetical protein
MAAAATLLDLPDFHRCRTYLHCNDASIYVYAGEEGRAKNFTKNTGGLLCLCVVDVARLLCATGLNGTWSYGSLNFRKTSNQCIILRCLILFLKSM